MASIAVILAVTNAQLGSGGSLFWLAGIARFNPFDSVPILSVFSACCVLGRLISFLFVFMRWGVLWAHCNGAMCLTCRLHFWVRPERLRLPAAPLTLSALQPVSERRRLFFFSCLLPACSFKVWSTALFVPVCIKGKLTERVFSFSATCTHINSVTPLRAAL